MGRKGKHKICVHNLSCEKYRNLCCAECPIHKTCQEQCCWINCEEHSQIQPITMEA